VAPSVQRRKVWLTPTTRMPCSNAAKKRNPLKLGRVPQTTGSISDASGPKFTIVWIHVDEILLLNSFSAVTWNWNDLTLLGAAVDKVDLTAATLRSTQMAIYWRLFACCIFSEPRAACFRPAP